MVQPIIDGRKAGESSPRQPVIAPDSARSVTLLKQVVGLSEGEIEGFGKNDIKLDGTPLSELSSEIVCGYRFGTNSQEYINGVDEVANEIGVGVELRGDLDWVKLITNTDIDHVGIRLRWGPLQTSHSNGDVSGVYISYQILIAPVGGAYEAVLVTTLSDKTSDSYERYHEFKLPPSDDGWMVKVVRTTPSAQSSLVSDKMYVQAYAEIIKSKFTFPYTSLIYLEYDARSFSNVAKLAVNAKGMIVKVPMNYDPVTRQYAGLWDGVFKMAYTNNPAWIYYDIVTQRRYGCGDRIDQSMVDKWSLYRLGQYCDQMVDDGYGGLEPRFTCNVYLQSKERVYDVLNRLTGLFRAINFWNGSQLVVDADIPQDTSYLYTNANVVDGLFEYAGTAATDLYSAVKVAWDNPANGYNTEYEAVSYEHLVKKLGFKTLELDAWGCTSRGQALRAGRWALLAESDTVTFKVGMDGYLAMPGKIIEIQDEFYAGKSVGGRVISVSSSGLEITLDRPVETIAGDTISFNTVLGVVKKFNIASSNGTVVTLTESVGSSVERMHIWAINSSQLATQKYRILSVKFDGVGEFTISAVEYDQNKYEEIDSNIVFDEAPTSIINPIAQVAVKNVTISSNEYVYQGLNTVNLEIKWERAENAVEYLVELKKDDGSWLKLPSTGNNSIVLENVYAGYYIASVTAISAYELKSLPAYSVKTVVLGKQSMPLPPLNPRIVPIQFGIEFYWDFPQGATDTAVSRIVVSYLDPTGAVDDSGFLTYDKAYSDNKIVIQNLDLHTRVWFKVRLIDKLGFESPYTSWISGIPSQDFDKVMDLISGQIEQSDLYYDLSQKIDVGYGASATATNAQTAANQAQASADQAQTAANQVQAQVTTTTTELRGLLNTTADGLTQEILDRQNGDADVVGQLTTYKTSNDAAMSAVQQQAEAATSASSANATALTNLNTEVVAAHNLASNALQQAQSATDATSTNASNLIALSSRMATAEQDINGIETTKLDASVIQQYRTAADQDTATASSITALRAQLASGARNFVRNTGTPHQDYGWVFQQPLTEKLTGEITISFDVEALDDPPVGYTGGGVGFSMGDSGVSGFNYVWYPNLAMKGHLTYTITTDSGDFTHFGIYANNYVKITNVMVQRGDVDYPWAAAPEDNEAAIEANAQAIRNTESTVATVDGIVTAQASDILNLSNGLTTLGNSKLDASIIQQYRTAVDQDSVTSGALTQFKSTLKVGGVNVLLNSKEPRSGVNEYLMYECTIELKDFYDQNLNKDVTVSCEIYVPVAGNVQIYTSNSSAHNFSFGTPIPANQWTRVVATVKPIPHDTNPDWATSSLEFYGEYGTGRIVTVRNVQLEAGNFATDWSPSPRDYAEDVENVASALSETNTRVGSVENGIASQANQLTSLSTKLNARKIYQLYSGGLEAVTGMGRIEGFDPNSYYGIERSYGLVVFNSDGSIQSVSSYDVWGGSTQGFIDAVAAVPTGTYVAVLTSDEPSANKGLIKPSLRSLGGSDAIDQVNDRCAYLLVGRKGLPTGQAIEKISNTPTFGVDYVLEMFNGVPIGLGGSSPQSDIVSNMRTEVSNIGDNITSLSETVTSHTASLSVVVQGTYSKTHVLDLRGLDENLYYPVVMTLATAPSSKLRIFRTLGSFPERPSWSTHWNGFDCKLEWVATGDGWGTTSRDLTILANDYRFAQAVPFLGLGQITEISCEFIHLRGGAQYYLDTSSSASDPRIITSAETLHGRTLAPMSYVDSYIVSAPDLKLKASAEALTQTRAEVQELDGQVTALAVETNTLSTTVGNNTAAIQLQQSSIDGINAKATLQVEAGGTIGGVALGNNGGVVDFLIRSNTFAITTPEGVPNDTKYMMTYQANDQTLPNGTVIPKGLKVNDAIIGTINASKIYADSLSAISGTFGTITTLQDATKPLGVRTVMTGGVTVVYDDNNIRRARFGFWSD